MGLLNLIGKLNGGTDLTGKPLKGALGIFPGAVVNPGGRAMDPQIRRLEKKMKAGARFFQTQATFSVPQMAEFMGKVRPTGAKIIAGVLLVRTIKTARFLQEKVPGIFVPDDMFQMMEKASNPGEAGIEYAANLVKEYMGLCDGVHLMAIRAEEKLIEVLARAGVKKS